MTINDDNAVPPDGAPKPPGDTGADSSGSDEPNEALREIIAQRNKLKKEKQELAAELEKARKAEQQRKAQSMSTEEQLEQLRTENNQYKALEEHRLARQRQDAFVAEVAKHVELDTRTVRALMLAAREDDKNLDIAPEAFSKTDVLSAAKAVREASPDLFKPKPGASTPAPSTGIKPKDAPGAAAVDPRRQAVIASARDGGVLFRKNG